jgi:hypothetical protein
MVVAMTMTREELREWLDGRFAEVIEEAKQVTPQMDDIERTGTIAALLLSTGVHLTAKHGAPRELVENTLLDLVEDAYRDDA